jgi:hypothetical protein
MGEQTRKDTGTHKTFLAFNKTTGKGNSYGDPQNFFTQPSSLEHL